MPAKQKHKILIIDNDKDLVRKLNAELSSNGYDVVVATDAISAISVTRKENPDLIILELTLPAGDGFTVMKRLKSLHPVTPMIIHTGKSTSDSKERALRDGAKAFIEKSTHGNELLVVIKRSLEETYGEGEESPVTKKRILIVDDDVDFVRALNIQLSSSGYDVVVATDAISAISVTRKENHDLVILDLGLPAGDGFLVLERLKSLYPVIPVVILTVRSPEINKERLIRLGAKAFFQKPANKEQLLTAIRENLE